MTPEERIMKQEAVVIAYKDIFAGPNGQLVLGDLAKFCLAKRDIFVESSARKTDYNLGANAVYRYIIGKIELKSNEPKQEGAINE